jgi:uncharacterized membrane protein YeaQ/YmgE (transglycosylase-associated protein family)
MPSKMCVVNMAWNLAMTVSCFFCMIKAYDFTLRLFSGQPSNKQGTLCHSLSFSDHRIWSDKMGILWTIVIGFVAGIIAKFLHPGPNEPSGFILTTILGIVGAFLATFLGQALGWYRADQGAGLIGAVVGAVIVLFIWSMLARRNTTSI